MDKASLPPSYGWVFTAVTLWTIVVFFVGAVTNPPSGGSAAFMWGFTIWYMYKKDIKALVSLHRFLMWLGFLAAILVFLWAAFNDLVSSDSVAISFSCLVSGGVWGALYSYFTKITSSTETVIPAESDASSLVPIEKPTISKQPVITLPSSPATTPVTRLTDDVLARLEKIASLRDRGILTEQEFAAEKAIILEANPSSGAT
jgi:hypothetical protein